MYIKYPRTYHLPYSETLSADDKRLKSDDIFKQMNEVYCSIKMDGENTTVYSNGYIHARSIDGNKHPWQSWLKQHVQSWCKDIPKGWRICGENLYARHSIKYTFSNEGYLFQMFGIYNEKNECLSFEDTWFCADLLGIKMVDVFYVGKYDKDLIMQKFKEYKNKSQNEVEGFVIRNCDKFAYEDFSKNVGKYVRANHVQTDAHWTENWEPNKIERNNILK